MKLVQYVFCALVLSLHTLVKGYFKDFWKRSVRTQIRMNAEKVIFPIKVKDVVTRLTQSTQNALEQKLSRLEIQLPPVFDLGIGERSDNIKESTSSRINRELAKLFLEMFLALKETAVVIFPTETEAKIAEALWTKKNFLSSSSAKRQIYHFSEKIEFKALPKNQRKLLEEKRISDPSFNLDDYLTLKPDLPTNTELVIVISPQPKDYPVVLSLHQQFGMGTLILLINPRFVWNNFLAKKDSDVVPEAPVQLLQEPTQSSDHIRDSSPTFGKKRRNNRDKVTELATSNQLSKDYLRMYELMTIFPNSFYYSPPVLANQQLMKEITKNRNILLFHEKVQSEWYLFEKLSDMPSSSSTSNPLNALTAMMTNLVDKLDESKTIRILFKSSKKPTEEEIIKILQNTE